MFVASKVLGFTQAILGLIAPLASLTVALLTLDIAALPLDGIIVGIALLAAGAWLVYSNWSSIGPALKKLFTGIWDSIRPPSWVLRTFEGLLPGPIQGAIDATVSTQAGSPRPAGWSVMPQHQAPKVMPEARNPKHEPSRFVFEFTGDRAKDVQVKKMAPASGLTVDFKRGIVNGGPG